MKVYDSYRFKDKDPIIDIARTCVEIYAAMHGLSFGAAVKQVSKSSCVAVDTMYRWFRGNVISPRFCTVVAVVHATGRKVTVGDKSLTSKPRFRSIRGGKAA